MFRDRPLRYSRGGSGRPTPAEAGTVSLLDELKQVVFKIDRHGCWTYLNHAWTSLSGHGVDTTLGASCLAHVHPDDLDRERALLAQLLSGQRDECRHELRLLRRDGRVRRVEVFARARRDGDGAVDGIAGTLLDASDASEARALRKLAAGIFASCEEGIVVTSPQGLIVDVNAAFETITGYARADVLGKNPRLLSSGRQGKEFYAAMWHSVGQTGSWSGEVWNRRKSGEFYIERLTITAIHDDDDGRLTHHVGVFADITHQKRQDAHLARIAHHDALTGLANRQLLADRLQQAMGRARRNGTGMAVACLDLDDFRTINGVHGHECGDELLIALGRRIQETVRDSDTTCRLGGDEFVVVFDGVESQQACQAMMARLLAAIGEPVCIGDAVLRVSASAGLACYREGEDIDADQLIRHADQAMYDAKQDGRNRFRVFDSFGHRAMVERAAEIEAIEGALARREFALHYQPIVHLVTGELNSVEALVRWNHPERGCLAPASFLPALEGHPLMVALENWILEEALRQHERWLGAGLDVAISVNVSGAQLRRRDFVRYLRALFEAHPRVNPRRIKLEVLESSALEDIGHVSDLIGQCAQIGVGFALDDFGTGYSSLRYLKQLPARRIKIDQGFVRNMLRDPDDLAILEGIAGMAAAFKRELVAEGVESMEHAVMLVRLGCLLAQGYGIARPMPADDLAPWLAQWWLPAAMARLAPLERGDTLLLRALVEQRAWQAQLDGTGTRDRPWRTDATCGVPAFDEWRAGHGRKRSCRARKARRAAACRDDLVAQEARLRAAAEPDRAAAALNCRQAGLAFADALEHLLDA